MQFESSHAPDRTILSMPDPPRGLVSYPIAPVNYFELNFCEEGGYGFSEQDLSKFNNEQSQGA